MKYYALIMLSAFAAYSIARGGDYLGVDSLFQVTCAFGVGALGMFALGCQCSCHEEHRKHEVAVEKKLARKARRAHWSLPDESKSKVG